MAEGHGHNEINFESGNIPWRELTSKVNAVCHLALVNGRKSSASASGFLATCLIHGQLETFMMCNNHFIATKEDASQVIVTFLFDDENNPVVVELDANGFFKTNKELDYTMVRIKEKDLNDLLNVHKIPPIKLKKGNFCIKKDDVVHIPQHPNGKSKRLSSEKLEAVEGTMVWYKADTDDGSSGSPVFCTENNTLQLLAIHKAGGSHSPNGKITNKGILISSILEHVNKQNQGKIPVARLSSHDESGLFVSDGNTTTNQGFPIVHPHSPSDSPIHGSPNHITEHPNQDVRSPSCQVDNNSHSPFQKPTQETPVSPQAPVKDVVLFEKPFTPRELLRIAQSINCDWWNVAVFTQKFQTWELKNIDRNNHLYDSVAKANNMLDQYKSRLGTRETLAEAIGCCEMLEEAKDVRSGRYQLI